MKRYIYEMYTHSFARDLPKLETNQAYVNHRTVNYGKVNEGILHISKTEQSTTAAQVDLQSATGLGEGPKNLKILFILTWSSKVFKTNDTISTVNSCYLRYLRSLKSLQTLNWGMLKTTAPTGSAGLGL